MNICMSWIDEAQKIGAPGFWHLPLNEWVSIAINVDTAKMTKTDQGWRALEASVHWPKDDKAKKSLLEFWALKPLAEAVGDQTGIVELEVRRIKNGQSKNAVEFR